LAQAEEILLQVAQYVEPADQVQRVCDHPAEIIKLQKKITDLKSQQFVASQCDHTEIENQIRTLTVTAQAGTKILGHNGGRFLVVSKELCYGKAETLEDAEEVARLWWYNSVQ
jgi:hypothetical protein